MIVDPAPIALHFDAVWQITVQAAGPHVALQSAPAVQVQTLSLAHAHPAPVQPTVGGAESSPPHETSETTVLTTATNSAR